jgi:signal transduction histidine kinase
MFGALVLLGSSVAGTVTLAWLTASALGWAAPAGPGTAAILLVSAAIWIGLLVTLLVVVVHRFLRPLGGVMEAADRVAKGDYDAQVAERGSAQVRNLARAFNAMTARLRDHDRVRRDLMADIAHELRTPLTVIQGKLEGLLDGVYAIEEAQLQQLLDESRVLSRLVEDLRTLALSESGGLKLQLEPTDVVGLARETADSFAAAAAEKEVRLDVSAAGPVAPISLDPVRIREVLGNLLTNALRHTAARRGVTIAVADAPDTVTIEVRDEGSGMRPEELARAFDRFFKGSGSRGSGLGLAIARGLVTAHGGEILASSTPGRGTVVTLTLPRTRE